MKHAPKVTIKELAETALYLLEPITSSHGLKQATKELEEVVNNTTDIKVARTQINKIYAKWSAD
jgi:hypothetical protein